MEGLTPMSSVRILLVAMSMVLLFTVPARAQFNPWPQPLPAAPIWGDYDEGHAWHDAGWWSSNRPDWARAHHPEWWGDYNDDHIWQPAAWWWNNRPDWVRAHHPEWWGDYYQGNWYPASWWQRYQPQWARLHHPEWWGDFNQDGNWEPAGWWAQNQPGWTSENHPDWWGDYYQGQWYPASWWAENQPDSLSQNHPDWWGDDFEGEWYPASWWWQNQPVWVGQNYPGWWGDYDDDHVWRPAGWWWQRHPGWCHDHHPEWVGDYDAQHGWHPVSWWAQRNPTWAHEHHPEWKETLRQVKGPTHLRRPAEVESRRLADMPNRDRDRARDEPAADRAHVAHLEARQHQRGREQFEALREPQSTERHQRATARDAQPETARGAQWEQVEPGREDRTLDSRHWAAMSANDRRRWDEDRIAPHQHWAQQASVARERQIQQPDFNRRAPDTFARERTAPSFHSSPPPTHFGNSGGAPTHSGGGLSSHGGEHRH
jgi:hypothetical protein